MVSQFIRDRLAIFTVYTGAWRLRGVSNEGDSLLACK